ncbi:thioesterase II family protein [Desulfoluna butyratoxydans]|uniref:Alpha/beta hydrolase fold n=1 Tax=Desulfoluna butyratoxydans TaxID=231438 RepID=A0A4U8YSF4_9BACT|nr:alpha/beta fold hydrolase [Desulfoluna butyratoxydans]VFQ46269.1 alpha/beta hydrolase fold [Desulfoluna butyratoxydans]
MKTLRYGLLVLLALTGLVGCDEIPVADTGEDRIVATGAEVTLDGSGSTGLGPLAYRWELTPPEYSTATLSCDDSITPVFTPDVPGRYTVRLVVSNLFMESVPDEQVVVAAPAGQCLYRPLPRKNPRLRVFCFPYAGQGAQIYDPWLSHLGEDVELVSVMFPGRFYRDGEAAFTLLDDIVDEVCRDITPLTDVPFVFFGHCMGALIGFEVADRLEEQGLPRPFHLVMSGTPAPQLPVYGQRPPLHNLPEEPFIAFLLQIGLIDQEMADHKEDHAELFSWIRSDFEMVDTWAYTPGMIVQSPITALGGEEDMAATHDQILAWQEVTEGGFACRMFPGEHFFIDSSREDVLAILNAILDDRRE